LPWLEQAPGVEALLCQNVHPATANGRLQTLGQLMWKKIRDDYAED
jgi:hypothetical protein